MKLCVPPFPAFKTNLLLGGGLIAIRQLIFFLDFRNGEMAKMAEKFSPFSSYLLSIFSPFSPAARSRGVANSKLINFEAFSHYLNLKMKSK